MPTHEEIAVAAYYLWLAECVSAQGQDDEQLIRPAEENWLAAEAQLRLEVTRGEHNA